MAGFGGMSAVDFQAQALNLYAKRGQVLAANIANADTPGYLARDFNFQQALAAATGGAAGSAAGAGASGAAGAAAPVAMARTNPAHLNASGAPAGDGSSAATPPLLYQVPLQASMDGNTVNIDQQRAEFAQNSVRYEATVRFLSSKFQQMTTVITG